MKDLMEENALLKAQLAQVIDFVDQQFVAANASSSLQDLFVSRLGPRTLAESLLKSMATVASPLYTKAFWPKKTEITNDDLCVATSKLIEPIRKIADINHADSLKQAHRLVFELRAW